MRAQVLSGAEEGRLSAFGVIAGIPDANGVVGRSRRRQRRAGADLGRTGRRRRRPCPSGRCGSHDIADDEKRLRDTIDRHLDDRAVARTAGRQRLLCRRRRVARARAHPHGADGYPLHVIQQYTLARGEAERFPRCDRAPVAQIAGEDDGTVSRKRLEVVPFAARVLLPPAAPDPAQAARLLRRWLARGPSLQPARRGGAARRSAARRLPRRWRKAIAASAPTARSCSPGPTRSSRRDAGASPAAPRRRDPERHRLARASRLPRRAGAAHALYMPVPGIDHAEPRLPRARAPRALRRRRSGRDGAASARRGRLRRGAQRRPGAAARLHALGRRAGFADGREARSGERHAEPDLRRKSGQRLGESVQRRLDALGRALGKKTEIRV